MKTGIGQSKYRNLTLFHVVWSVPAKVFLTVTLWIEVCQNAVFIKIDHYDNNKLDLIRLSRDLDLLLEIRQPGT